MSHRPIDVAVNPNNSAQRYILWTNGRIDNQGGAPPITGPGWYDTPITVAAALHITDWVNGRGYVLSIYGEFVAVGGAPDLMTGTQVVGDQDRKVVPGVPYFADWHYIDWSWNPNGNGQGYVLDRWGQLRAFGGATAPPRAGARFTSPIALRLKMQWAPTKRAMTLDVHGGMYADWFTQTPTPAFPNAMSPYLDFARDFHINWENAPVLSGYTLDLHGTTHPFGGAPVGSNAGTGMWPNSGAASVLHVLSTSDPVRMWQVWWGGQQFEYTWTGPPTVKAGGEGTPKPPTQVTDTTRPTLAWDYSDPQADSQAAWQLLVFTQTFVNSHSMTNPLAWAADAVIAQEGNQRTTRGIISPVDLDNGAYRFYVRAQDSAGQWSAWSNRAWTQAVPVPDAPTGMTAVPDDATLSVILQVTGDAGDADLVRFEWTEDGTTWSPVRGATAVPLSTGTTTARDRDAPLGPPRTYRARAYSIEPRVASGYSGTATAALTRTAHVLTSTADPALGGPIQVQDPAEWTRPVRAGLFDGIGAPYPTVVSDGTPKGRRATLNVLTLDRASWERIEELAESDSTLVYRDPFGEVMYCRLVGDWSRRQLRAAPLLTESTPLRHAHTTGLPLVEVAPPAGD